jgi:hypothetical protein
MTEHSYESPHGIPHMLCYAYGRVDLEAPPSSDSHRCCSICRLLVLCMKDMKHNKKSKRIPFIFNDESTGSCMCLWKLAVAVATDVSIFIVYRIHPSFAFENESTLYNFRTSNYVQQRKTYTTKAAMVYLYCYNSYITCYARP